MYGSIYAGTPYASANPLGDPIPAYDGIIVYVGSRGMTAHLSDGTLSKRCQLWSNATLQAVLTDKENAVSIEPGEEIAIYRDGESWYAGTVDRVIETFPSMDTACAAKSIKLRCVDWNKLAAKRIVTTAYDPQLAGDIVKDLIARYLDIEGVTDDGVEDGLIIGPLVFRYKTLSSVLSSICRLIDYHWYIGYDKDFKFIAREMLSAPFDISNGTRNYSKLSVEKTRAEYRNVQIVKGGSDLVSARIREFEGDGETATFSVESPIGALPTIEVNSVPQSVGLRGVDDEDDEDGHDWFWSKGETSISQNTTATALSDTDVLSVTYQALIPIISMTRDQAAIDNRSTIEGGSGIYEAVVSETDIEKDDVAGWLGESYIRRHAQISQKVSVITYEEGIRPGQLQQITLTAEDIDDEFLITSTSEQERGGGQFRTTYRAVNNVASGGWVEFYRRLIETGTQLDAGGDDTANPIAQVGAVISVEHTENTAEGNSIGDTADDPYTCWLITDGTAVGCQYSEEGTTYSSGPIFGEIELGRSINTEIAQIEFIALDATAAI